MNNNVGGSKAQDHDQTHQIVGLLQEVLSGQKKSERILRNEIRDLQGDLADHVETNEKRHINQDLKIAKMANLSLKESSETGDTPGLESTRNDDVMEVEDPNQELLLNPIVQEYINKSVAEAMRTGARPKESRPSRDDAEGRKKKDGGKSSGSSRRQGASTSRRGRSRSPVDNIGGRSESRKKVDHLGRPRVDKDGNKLVYPTTKSLPLGGVREDYYNILLTSIDFADRTKGLNPVKEKHRNTAKRMIENDEKDPEDGGLVNHYCLKN